MAEWKVKGEEVVADMAKAVKEEYGECNHNESEFLNEPIVTQIPKLAQVLVPSDGEESDEEDAGEFVPLVNSMDASSISV